MAQDIGLDTSQMFDEDGLVLLMLYALHQHVPEDQRPMSMSDLSDEQAERARTAVRLLASALHRHPLTNNLSTGGGDQHEGMDNR